MNIAVEILKDVKIVYESGEPKVVRFFGALVFTDMTEKQRALFGFEADSPNKIVIINGTVNYKPDLTRMKSAITNAANKQKQAYLNKIKSKSSKMVSIDGFNEKLTTLADLNQV